MAQLVEHRGITTNHAKMELTQPRRLRQQERHKFAYLTMTNNSFTRFACALFSFGGFVADIWIVWIFATHCG